MNDQLSMMTGHIELQNDTIRRVDEERQSLVKITELLAKSDEKVQDALPEPSSNIIYMPTVTTRNRFEILADEDDTPGPNDDEQPRPHTPSHLHQTNDCGQYDVIVAGDSMLRHIEGRRLSRRRKVKCHAKPGARVEHILHTNICNDLRREGEAIIHVGTNNQMEDARSVHDKIKALSEAITSTGRTVCISGIIHRRWETRYERQRVETLNSYLRSTATNKEWGYIDHSNIGDRHLGVDGVHLNKSGQSVFAGNISRHINRRHYQPISNTQINYLNQRNQDKMTHSKKSHYQSNFRRNTTMTSRLPRGYNAAYSQMRRNNAIAKELPSTTNGGCSKTTIWSSREDLQSPAQERSTLTPSYQQDFPLPAVRGSSSRPWSLQDDLHATSRGCNMTTWTPKEYPAIPRDNSISTWSTRDDLQQAARGSNMPAWSPGDIVQPAAGRSCKPAWSTREYLQPTGRGNSTSTWSSEIGRHPPAARLSRDYLHQGFIKEYPIARLKSSRLQRQDWQDYLRYVRKVLTSA